MLYCLELRTSVSKSFDGHKLIDFLVSRFTYHDSDGWITKVKAGLVLINDCAADAEALLQKDDEILFRVPDFFEPDLDLNYQTIWENENLLLVSKPADLPVHSIRRFYYQTMTAVLRRDTGIVDLNPLHRLDRETSGLMAYLKKPFSLPPWCRNPQAVLGKKYYIALVEGVFTAQSLLTDFPLRQANCPPVNYKMIVAADGQLAQTFFYGLGSVAGKSLVLARLASGRKHQIRAHLQHLGFPIIGDKLYAHGGKYFLKRCDDDLNEEDFLELGANHHLLHAWALEICLPDHEKQTVYSDHVSSQFAGYLASFGDWQQRARQIMEKMDE